MRKLFPCVACVLLAACAEVPQRTAAPAPAITEARPEVLAAVRHPGSPSLLAPLRFEYPIEARRQGQEGSVHLRMRVLPDGSVGKVEVLRSSGAQSLDLAAMRAAASAKFTPPKQPDGTPAEAWVVLPITFKLEP